MNFTRMGNLRALGRTLAVLMCILAVYPARLCAAAPALEHIRQIDLIHFSHTDYGFTDHPAVCRDLQVRYLDVALDTVNATRHLPPEARFHWTAETTIAVLDWWKRATPARQNEFLQAVRDGQIEVTALPFNNTPFLNAEQWQVMTHWLPEDLWNSFRPRTAVQNDVNGFPRAGARALLDRGVRYLFTGINSDSGGPPFPRLTTFWWKQPDGRRLFVYMSLSYGDGFFMFETEEWRRGPLPRAADGTYRPPRAGDILKTDENSLRKAHERCISRLRGFEKNGYRLPVLAVSMTSMWRYDNDPPFPPLSDFVAAWNRLGLQPRLRLVTVSEAMQDLEKAAGASAMEYSGEWTDWWANGTACAPREVAASRFAKRFLCAAQSPAFGPLDDSTRARVTELWQDLCLFDEHTWGSGMSVAQPYSLDAQGQWNEKARFAWRPMALAEWLLGQRARTRFAVEGEGLWVANPTGTPFTGWATMISTCLRRETHSIVDTATGTRAKLYYEPGPIWGRPSKQDDLSYEDVSATFPDRSQNRFVRFWVENLQPHSAKQFQFGREEMEDTPVSVTAPTVTTNASGWPTSAIWPGMNKPLFTEGMGDFVSVNVNGFAPRWIAQDIWHTEDPARKAQLKNEKFAFVSASPVGSATVENNPHTILYTQRIDHPRLKWGTRKLELWRREPRARLTVRIHRISSFDPELLCIVSPMPCDGTLPRFSCGGMGFTPFADQLPGTCRDYFAIDGWAHYSTSDGNWLWVTRDAPLVTVDGPHPKSHITAPPPRTGRMLAIVYDNFWYTNFQGDSPGVMEFQFDLVWRAELDGDQVADTLASTLVTDPVLVINPGLAENPAVGHRLFKP